MPVAERHPHAKLPFSVRSYGDLEAWRRSEAVLGQDLRYLCELGLADRVAAQGLLSGVCWFCGRRTDFSFQPGAPGQVPNWREELACNGCGLICRVRLALLLACAHLEHIGPAAVPYVTEQVTLGFARLRARYPGAIGSEYVADARAAARLTASLVRRGDGVGASVRHEDVTALSLGDRCTDAVLSFEVLEHVPDYRRAVGEFHRVLRPGGALVLSVPFVTTQHATVVRATMDADGAVRHLLEPEYHGDPTTTQGCLAFYNFGWDLLDDLRHVGFVDVGLVDAWSPASAFLGAAGIIVARKP